MTGTLAGNRLNVVEMGKQWYFFELYKNFATNYKTCLIFELKHEYRMKRRLNVF